MKKIIKLNEDQLVHMVKKVMNEQFDMDQSTIMKGLFDKVKELGSQKIGDYFKNMTPEKSKKLEDELMKMSPEQRSGMTKMMLNRFRDMGDKKINDFFTNMTPEKAKQLEAEIMKMSPEQRSTFRKMMFDRMKNKMGQNIYGSKITDPNSFKNVKNWEDLKNLIHSKITSDVFSKFSKFQTDKINKVLTNMNPQDKEKLLNMIKAMSPAQRKSLLDAMLTNLKNKIGPVKY